MFETVVAISPRVDIQSEIVTVLKLRRNMRNRMLRLSYDVHIIKLRITLKRLIVIRKIFYLGIIFLEEIQKFVDFANTNWEFETRL